MTKKITGITVFLLLLYTGLAFGSGVIALPQTGQTKCYSESGQEIACKRICFENGFWSICGDTGQDGQSQAGAPWPVPRFTVGAGAEASCVTDNLTGLMWPKEFPATHYGVTWEDAIDASKGSTLCGHSDWRLPNINELASIVNAGEGNNSLWLSQTFGNIEVNLPYWSSTTYTFGSKWIVNPGNGIISKTTGSPFSNEAHYLPVRTAEGGPFGSPVGKTGQTTSYRSGDDGNLQKGVSWPSPRFTNPGNGEVTDNLTGLVWAKDANAPGPAACAPGTRKTWQGALDHVTCLNSNNYLGRSDWRLPNIQELQSLVDHSQESLLPSGHPFVNVLLSTNGCWSSTTYAGGKSQAWVLGDIPYNDDDIRVAFYEGKTETRYVWPVRSGRIDPQVNLAVSKSGTGIGTVKSNPAGIDCGAVCSYGFDNVYVTLTAIPAPGSEFAGWTGECPGYDRTCTVLSGFMNTSKSITAMFVQSSGNNQAAIGAVPPTPRFSTGLDLFGQFYNGCVIDNLTGLMWPTRVGEWMTGTIDDLSRYPKTWSEAIDYSLRASFCGYSDWRLPNINELESLLKAGEADNSLWLRSQGFRDVFAQRYWSSTTDAYFEGGSSAWYVDMGGSRVDAFWKTSEHYVLPVRSYQWPAYEGEDGNRPFKPVLGKTGQTVIYRSDDDGALKQGVSWPSPRFTDHGNGEVTDNLTTLVWAKDANTPGPVTCLPGADKSWQGALDYVACLNAQNYLGHSDWRLPGVKEMRSLVDHSKSVYALPAGHPFVNVQYEAYWAGSMRIISMGLGYTMAYSDGTRYHVWPVRTASPRTVLSMPGGAYTSPQAITITFNAGQSGAISYTTDGSDPLTSPTRRQYTGPIGIAETTTLKYHVTGAGGYTEPVRTEVYTIAADSLPRTGQERCYNVAGAEVACTGTGQDGETRAGVTWPSPRFVAGTGAAAGCITDTLTGLMWPRNANLWNGVNNIYGVNTISWYAAIDGANSMSFCGYSDWRLPNVNEFQSLINPSGSSPDTWLTGQGFAMSRRTNTGRLRRAHS